MILDKGKAVPLKRVEVSESYTPTLSIDLSTCIKGRSDNHLNPITRFSLDSRHLRQHHSSTRIDYRIANFSLLGHVSLSERYIRQVMRTIIQLDPITKDYVLGRSISYASALYLNQANMADAMLESYSFASSKNIESALKDILGNFVQSDTLKRLLKQFDIICQLRHCIAHRYFEFGTNNAISIDFTPHQHLLLDEIRMDFNNLEAALETIDVTVRTMNDEIFSFIVSRQIQYGYISGIYTADKENFTNIYSQFKLNYDGYGILQAYWKFVR